MLIDQFIWWFTDSFLCPGQFTWETEATLQSCLIMLINYVESENGCQLIKLGKNVFLP